MARCRYWAATDVPGHSYRISSYQAYTQPQREVWDREFSKPCDDFYRTSLSDLGGDVSLNDASRSYLEQVRLSGVVTSVISLRLRRVLVPWHGVEVPSSTNCVCQGIRN